MPMKSAGRGEASFALLFPDLQQALDAEREGARREDPGHTVPGQDGDDRDEDKTARNPSVTMPRRAGDFSLNFRKTISTMAIGTAKAPKCRKI